MQERIGRYITQKVGGESYKAYIPPQLPLDPPLDVGRLYPLLEKATLALAKLNSIHQTIPNADLFMYMDVRKEALLSSQIEGTQSSFSDLMLFEHHQKTDISLDDVEEVSHYVKAIRHGLVRLQEGFPLSLRLLKEIHGLLLSGGRGSHKLPGEWRRSQNWIGGTRPGNALFVPPPPEYLEECLSNFEHFLHDESLPVLIMAGIAHVQFETIHPFLDGNGRLGRLLIVLILCEKGLLDAPILYISLYLKQNRATYYALLQEVRMSGMFETWLEFFLMGVSHAATKAMETAQKMNALFEHDLEKIHTLGRSRLSCMTVFDFMKRLPKLSVPVAAKALNISAPTARSALHHLTTLGIVEEMSGKKRDKVYTYSAYLNLLEEGAEPL